MHATYVTRMHYISTYARNLLFDAKSDKIFQGPIVCNFNKNWSSRILKVALIFLSKIFLSRGVDDFIKGIKKGSSALLNCISTREFLKTRENCLEKHEPKANSRVLIQLNHTLGFLFLYEIFACFIVNFKFSVRIPLPKSIKVSLYHLWIGNSRMCIFTKDCRITITANISNKFSSMS